VLIELLVGAVVFSAQPSITAVYDTWCSGGVAVPWQALEGAHFVKSSNKLDCCSLNTQAKSR